MPPKSVIKFPYMSEFCGVVLYYHPRTEAAKQCIENILEIVKFAYLPPSQSILCLRRLLTFLLFSQTFSIKNRL